jgi:hypothetical protein
MKRSYYSFIIILVFFSCSKKTESKNPDTIIAVQKENTAPEKPTKNDWQAGFDLTHDIDIDSINKKPVRFYIENKDCDKTAIDFYYGKYRPMDEEKTADLLALSTTGNNDLRPFYRWILNKTILISDGALGEYTGVPARKYAEKFPEEFFKYMDIDKTNGKYNDWTGAIEYSGFYDYDDYKNPDLIRKQLIALMIKNSNADLKNRITKFAMDCFPNTNNFD